MIEVNGSDKVVLMPGEYNRENDRQFHRLKHDLCDPHFGIGALCMNDLKATPESVMRQGKQAETEIIRLRQKVRHLEGALKDIVDHASGTLEMDDGEKGYAVHSDFIFAAEELLK